MELCLSLKQKGEIAEQYESNGGAERCRKLRKTSHDEMNTGWLGSFRKTHNISFQEICGEAADVSEQTWTGS